MESTESTAGSTVRARQGVEGEEEQAALLAEIRASAEQLARWAPDLFDDDSWFVSDSRQLQQQEEQSTPSNTPTTQTPSHALFRPLTGTGVSRASSGSGNRRHGRAVRTRTLRPASSGIVDSEGTDDDAVPLTFPRFTLSAILSHFPPQQQRREQRQKSTLICMNRKWKDSVTRLLNREFATSDAAFDCPLCVETRQPGCMCFQCAVCHTKTCCQCALKAALSRMTASKSRLKTPSLPCPVCRTETL